MNLIGNVYNFCSEYKSLHLKLWVGKRGYRWVLGDRNYWSPELKEQGRQQGLVWLTPYKSAKREKKAWPKWLSHNLYLIDTVFSQLTERFNAKRV